MGELAVTRDPAPADDSFDSVGRDRLPDASAAVRIASRRDRFNGWFVAHEVAWELLMAALAIVYVALGLIADDVEAAAADRPEINAAELALTGIFAVEFAARDRPCRRRLPDIRIAHDSALAAAIFQIAEGKAAL
jgi:hypothetical protein